LASTFKVPTRNRRKSEVPVVKLVSKNVRWATHYFGMVSLDDWINEVTEDAIIPYLHMLPILQHW
jgi:hypothetical protein